MKISWKLFIPLIFLIIIATSVATVYIINSLSDEKVCLFQECPTLSDNAEEELEAIKAISKNPKSVSELDVTGWIPDWDFADGFTSFQKQVASFSSISPVWFELNEDGSLKILSHANDSEFLTFVQNREIELLPTIACFDAEIIHNMLNNSESRLSHVENITAEVINNNYDGIDLDYESVYLEDQEPFFSFLENLSQKLHDKNKKLVFTSVAKWGEESVLYTFLPQTRRTFDYQKLSTLADEFRIMTYDYTSRDSKSYGPVAPITWVEDVIKYTIYAGVPREKLVVGIPTYAFDWSERPQLSEIEYYPVLNIVSDEDLPTAFAYYEKSLNEILNTYSVSITFDENWGESIGVYTDENNENRIVVFPTQKSIDLRKKLTADYGLKGVAYWRIGDEEELKY